MSLPFASRNLRIPSLAMKQSRCNEDEEGNTTHQMIHTVPQLVNPHAPTPAIVKAGFSASSAAFRMSVSLGKHPGLHPH